MFDFMLCGGITSFILASLLGLAAKTMNWNHIFTVLPGLSAVSLLSLAGALFVFVALQLAQPVLVGSVRSLEIVIALGVELIVETVVMESEQLSGGGIHLVYKVTGSLIVTSAVILLGFADKIHQKLFHQNFEETFEFENDKK